MSISLGSTNFGSIYLGSTKIGEAYLGSVKVYGSSDPYNPLNLPPYTIRLKFNDGVTPTFSSGTAVQVSSSPNVWDLTYENTDWGRLVYGQSDLTEVLGANTTGVTSATMMISYCPALTAVALFDTRSVTNMLGMFSGNTLLTTIPLFDTSSVMTMEGMFADCPALTSVPLLNTRSVTTMKDMFYRCTSLTTVPLFDTSSLTTVWEMFRGCTSLTTVPLFNTSSVTSFQAMFYGCTSLASVPLFNTSAATNMASMFSNCTSITTVPLLDTSSATTLLGMLYGCSALTAVPLFDTSSATDVRQMLQSCSAVSSGALALYQRMAGQANPPSNYSQCFKNCGSDTSSGAAELSHIPRSWGGTQNEYQNTYYLQINAASYNQIAFCDLHVNDASQALTSAQVNDGGWTNIPNSDINIINNGAKYKTYGDGFRAYFTSASGDVTGLYYYASKSDSYIASLNCTAILYGKKIGSNTWTEVKRTTYTQANNRYVSMSI